MTKRSKSPAEQVRKLARALYENQDRVYRIMGELANAGGRLLTTEQTLSKEERGSEERMIKAARRRHKRASANVNRAFAKAEKAVNASSAIIAEIKTLLPPVSPASADQTK